MRTARFISVVSGALLVAMAVIAGEPPLITLRAIGAVPEELSLRIMGCVSQQIGSVTNSGVLAIKSKTLDDIALGFASSTTSTAVVSHVNLILVAELKGESRRAAAMRGVAVINIGQLQSDDGEIFARRVEKEAVNGVVLALGLPSCPFFQCVLCPAKSLKELDQKPRGLCPPCTEKLRQMAVGGVKPLSRRLGDNSKQSPGHNKQ
jgi:hypothetical protein